MTHEQDLASEFDDETLQSLRNAHTGGDLEVHCWRAAAWIKQAQKCLRELTNIIDAAEHSDYLNGLAKDELVILEQLQELQKKYKDYIK